MGFGDLPPHVWWKILDYLVIDNPGHRGSIYYYRNLQAIRVKELTFHFTNGWSFGKDLFLVCKVFFARHFPLPAGWRVVWHLTRRPRLRR